MSTPFSGFFSVVVGSVAVVVHHVVHTVVEQAVLAVVVQPCVRGERYRVVGYPTGVPRQVLVRRGVPRGRGFPAAGADGLGGGCFHVSYLSGPGTRCQWVKRLNLHPAGPACVAGTLTPQPPPTSQ